MEPCCAAAVIPPHRARRPRARHTTQAACTRPLRRRVECRPYASGARADFRTVSLFRHDEWRPSPRVGHSARPWQGRRAGHRDLRRYRP